MALPNSTKVGMLVLTALIALAIIISWKTDLLMLNQGYHLIGSFESVEGLTIGSEVRYRGLKVGKVMKVDPGPHEIIIDAVIDRQIRFPADSELRVSYDGIVGLKFLEIKPGTAEAIYASGQTVYGVKTSGIVDFIDIGAQNLQETKLILENARRIVEDRGLQRALLNIGPEFEKLTLELRETNQGIRSVVADPDFQANVKGTISETKKTLSSANKFFDTTSKMNLRASAGLDIGTTANAVKGNVDVIQDENRYFRLGIGEGPTRQLSLLDVLFNSRIGNRWGFRLGVINNQLGGGFVFLPSKSVLFRTDVYDINNAETIGAVTSRLWPKLRLGYEYYWREYVDFIVKGDDLLNPGSRNLIFGIQVRPSTDRIL